MARKTLLMLSVLGGSLLVVSVTWLPVAGHASEEASTRSQADGDSSDEPRLTVEQAREHAEVAHSIYSATLDVVHQYYFRDDTAAVPARAMEQIFSRMARQENISARWISVNAPAMSIDHKPESDFEKQAAKAIGSGERHLEQVSNGIYRRAGAISLMGKGCLGCHLQGRSTGGRDRFAGLVISIPVDVD